jgi:hypothetical protein
VGFTGRITYGTITRWVVPEDSGQKTPRYLVSCKRIIQARHKNVEKVIVKFIEAEGKAP